MILKIDYGNKILPINPQLTERRVTMFHYRVSYVDQKGKPRIHEFPCSLHEEAQKKYAAFREKNRGLGYTDWKLVQINPKTGEIWEVIKMNEA